jgi:hypothetical protein
MAINVDNETAYFIEELANNNHRPFLVQLLLIIQASKMMNIKKVSYLPAPIGCHSVPVVEVSGEVILGGNT